MNSKVLLALIPTISILLFIGCTQPIQNNETGCPKGQILIIDKMYTQMDIDYNGKNICSDYYTEYMLSQNGLDFNQIPKVCSNCGDSICDKKLESPCNCPQDCNKISSYPIPNPNTCQNTITGWSCQVDYNNYSDNFYNKFCKNQGGELSCSSRSCDSFYCKQPLSDANKPCENSNECQGSCVIAQNFNDARQIIKDFNKINNLTYIAPKEYKGICSEHQKFFCDRRYELNDGNILEFWVICE